MGWLSDKMKEKNVLQSARSRNIMLYIFFIFVAAIFWGFLTFNRAQVFEVPVKIQIVGKPNDAHFLAHIPDTINVSVRDKASHFVKFIFKGAPTLLINFSDFSNGTSRFSIDQTSLNRSVAKLFNHSAEIIAVLPVNITSDYALGRGKKVPVVLDLDLEPADGYAQCGEVIKEPDSVTVYGNVTTLAGISEVYAFHAEVKDGKDTVKKHIRLLALTNAAIEPNAVDVKIPFGKLERRRITVSVQVRNAPSNVDVTFSPASVDVDYSTFDAPNQPSPEDITVVVDYNAINLKSPSNTVPVMIGEVPAAFRDVRVLQDSVKYFIGAATRK